MLAFLGHWNQGIHGVLTACRKNHGATGSPYDNERGGLDGSDPGLSSLKVAKNIQFWVLSAPVNAAGTSPVGHLAARRERGCSLGCLATPGLDCTSSDE